MSYKMIVFTCSELDRDELGFWTHILKHFSLTFCNISCACARSSCCLMLLMRAALSFGLSDPFGPLDISISRTLDDLIVYSKIEKDSMPRSLGGVNYFYDIYKYRYLSDAECSLCVCLCVCASYSSNS